MLSQVWHYLASFCLFLATITFLLIIHRTSAALYNSRVYANQAALTGGNYANVSTNSGSMEMSLDELYRCSGERSRRRRRRKRQEEAVDEEENGQEDEEELEKQTEELSRSRVKRRVPRPPFEVPYDISDEGDQFYY